MEMDTRSEGLQTPPHTCINPTQLGKQQLEQQITELAMWYCPGSGTGKSA